MKEIGYIHPKSGFLILDIFLLYNLIIEYGFLVLFKIFVC